MIGTAPDDLAPLLHAYRHASHYGPLPHASHRFEEYNPACGDSVIVDLEIGQDGCIQHASYRGGLCAVATASASALCSLAERRPIDWLQSLSIPAFLALLPFGVPKQRASCARLPLLAAQKALAHPI